VNLVHFGGFGAVSPMINRRAGGSLPVALIPIALAVPDRIAATGQPMSTATARRLDAARG
jgi:hypothetical protein